MLQLPGSKNVVLREAIGVKTGLNGPTGFGRDVICLDSVGSGQCESIRIRRNSHFKVLNKRVQLGQVTQVSQCDLIRSH